MESFNVCKYYWLDAEAQITHLWVVSKPAVALVRVGRAWVGCSAPAIGSATSSGHGMANAHLNRCLEAWSTKEYSSSLKCLLFHKSSCIKNVTHIILVMQNHSKWQKVNGSCQDYWRVIAVVSWHIKCEGFYLIIVQWSGWEVNIKCKTNAMQKECKALGFFSLCEFVALARSVILNPSIATADVLSPPSLIMYIWQFWSLCKYDLIMS